MFLRDFFFLFEKYAMDREKCCDFVGMKESMTSNVLKSYINFITTI